MATAFPSSRSAHSQQPYDTRDTRQPTRDTFAREVDAFAEPSAQRREFESSHFASAAARREFETPHFNPPPNPLAVVLAKLIGDGVNLTTRISRQLYTNSSVIILSAGLAGGVHYLASQYYPIASAAADPSFHGSVTLAKYVGLTFLIQAALIPIHQEFTQHAETGKQLINAHVVKYLTPIAMTWIVAYRHGIPVHLSTATLYTMGTFAAIKLLNMGYEFALKWYDQYNRSSERTDHRF